MSEVTVHFTYDNGDPSVGIPDGWEECYVTDGEATIFFRPSYDRPVAQWEVEDEQGDLVGEGFGSACLTRPWLFEPVEHKWNLMQAQEAANEADLAVAEVESEIGRIQYEASERHDFHPNPPLSDAEGAEVMQLERELSTLCQERDKAKAKLKELQEAKS